MLSDREIRGRLVSSCPFYSDERPHDDCTEPSCRRFRIRITPAPDDRAIQPASVDLKMGSMIKVELGPNSTQRPLYWHDLDITDLREGYPLLPGGIILADTAETITVPHDLAARVEGKSSLGRRFISVHETAGFIDPGFEGTITLEIKNNGPVVQYLKADMYICQINFTKLSSPALRPYGSEGLGSHYQGQSGPTASR